MNNYEKKYKEALEKAKESLKDGTITNIAISYIESIFPELKEEIEDDRIRNWLEEHIEAMPYNSIEFKDVKRIDVLYWLEKQGESDETKAKTFLINKGYPIDANGILPTYEEMYNIIREGLEDQCEQKPQGKSALEAINEEKIDNANKVESKFKAGDWIVRELDNSVHQVKAVIENISNGKYGYDLTKGGYISSQDANFYHLWTIQDAKAGDVLYSPKGAGVEGIFLIKGWEQVELTGKTLCSSIGYRVEENEIVVSGLGAIWWEGVVDPFYPATKEQRDKFEKAMTDAGYTFDFEKKELKKIEDEIEIPYGAKDSELQEETYYIPKGFHAEIDEDKVVIKKGEKPTAWSEEDEGILDEIIDFFENGTVKLQHDLSLYASWLKSLKGRVGCEANCTTTKEWSEEDIATISRVISIVKWAAYSDHSHPILNDEGATELVERLKSIKERYTWKPSDEQMDALQYVCRNLNPPLSDKLGWDSLKTLELLYKILKKLY